MQAVSLKVGTTYSARYVNQLYKQLKHADKRIQYTCLTDDAEGLKDEINVIPITDDFHDRKWWNKTKLFKPGLFKEPTVYLDLDCYVHQKFVDEEKPWGLEPFFDCSVKDKLNILKTYWFSEDTAKKIHQCDVNSSIMVIDESNGEPMWRDFVDNQEMLYKSFYGLDPWLYRRHSNNLNFFKPGLAYSYKHGCVFPDDTRANTFRQIPICVLDDVNDRGEILDGLW